MKTTTLSAVMAVSFLAAGCGKQPVPPSSSASAAAPVTQSALTAWQQGDKTAAVNSFVETDWSSGPLFSSSSALSLTEDQFKALSNSERQTKSSEMLPQIDSLKQLAAAVAQGGRDAVSKGDTAQARKYFTSLKQCGAALDTSNSLALVRLVGQGMKKRADTEMSTLPP
jgi:Tfp pilus assembly protein PilF